MPPQNFDDYNPEWSDRDIADLEGLISNMRDCLQDVGDFVVPDFNRHTSVVLTEVRAA